MEVNKKLVAAGVLALALLITLILGFNSIWAKNEDQNWQLVQSPTGSVSIRNEPGWYMAPFATIYEWPKASDTEEFGPFKVTFNDGGTADIKGVYRYRMPTMPDKQRILHREFVAGDGNVDLGLKNLERAITAHLENCLKNTGPTMSSSEHQSARKGEFYKLVDEQFRKGLYQAKKVQRELLDQIDEKGNPVKVWATEVVLGPNGLPLISEESPMTAYGVEVTQFSISITDYDPKTLEQFAAKKEAFLAAERNKAERDSQIQERLMVEERGKKEKAEVEAQANKQKATAIINAQREVEVASAAARQAEETKKQALVRANQEKEVAELEAERDRKVAELRLQSAKLDAEGVIVKAKAEEERIAKAGAITERDRILSEIERDAKIGVANALSRVSVPHNYFAGGSGSQGASGTDQGGLFNLILLRAAGLMPTESRPIEK